MATAHDGAPPVPVPLRRLQFATGDLAEAVEVIRSTYVYGPVNISGDTHGFLYRQHTTVAGDLAMDAVDYTMRTEHENPPFDYLCFVVTLRGRVSFSTVREEVQPAPGEVVLYPTAAPFRAVSQDLDLRVLRLPTCRVAQIAAARTGIDPADFGFDAMTPVSAAMGRHFRDTLNHLYQALHAADSALTNPLLLGAAIDLAATAAIATFPNTATAVTHVAGPGQVAPAVVRRAVDFIDAHAHEPITLADMAAAAGISPRALQAGFSQYLETTPTAYLRRVRLERAHRDLQAADPPRGDTVADIARRWGFAHLGRFAIYYQQTYWQSPSHTLRT